MRKKTLSIVLDAFIVLLLITIILLIILIVKRGEAPMEAHETQVETPPVVQTEPTVPDEKPEEPEEPTEEVKADLLARCNADGVNIRKGAGTDNDVMGMAAEGDEYKVIGNHANGWVEVEYKGSIGFIFGEYLDFYYMSGGEYTPAERSEVPNLD